MGCAYSNHRPKGKATGPLTDDHNEDPVANAAGTTGSNNILDDPHCRIFDVSHSRFSVRIRLTFCFLLLQACNLDGEGNRKHHGHLEITDSALIFHHKDQRVPWPLKYAFV